MRIKKKPLILMMRYTKTTLQKIEELFKDIEYTIRYEKGNFQSGYCIVENRKVAVINRFYDTEARINCLIEILTTLDFNETALSEKSQDLYKKIYKSIDDTSVKKEDEKPVEN